MVKDITWWRFDNAIDSKTCNKIIKLGKKDWEKATIKGEFENVIDTKSRETNVSWTTEQWLYDIVFEYMRSANEQVWLGL